MPIIALAVLLSPVRDARAQPAGELGWAIDEMAVLYEPFPYEAKDVALTDMLQQMTQKTGVPVVTAQGLAGRVSVSNEGGTVRDALDKAASDAGLLWWFDGGAVHVEPSSAMTSRLLPLQGVSVTALRNQLRAVGMDHTPYSLIADDRASVVRVVAPRGYIDAVAEVIAAVAAERSARGTDGSGAGLPRVIRGPQRDRRVVPREAGGAQVSQGTGQVEAQGQGQAPATTAAPATPMNNVGQMGNVAPSAGPSIQ